MPELPEVETTRMGLMPILGSSVVKLTVTQPRLRQLIPDSLQHIVGETLQSLSRRGKYLLLGTSKGTALIHLGMSGSLRLSSTDEPYRKHDHVILVLDNNYSLRFHDPRRFGLFLWLEDEPAQHSLLASWP
jgi:formamidopyrimidine-DNA glycosylase